MAQARKCATRLVLHPPHFAGIPGEQAAGRRQFRGFGLTTEQLGADPAFQPFHGQTHGWGRPVQAPGGPGEALFFGDDKKRPQIGKFHDDLMPKKQKGHHPGVDDGLFGLVSVPRLYVIHVPGFDTRRTTTGTTMTEITGTKLRQNPGTPDPMVLRESTEICGSRGDWRCNNITVFPVGHGWRDVSTHNQLGSAVVLTASGA